MEKGKERGYRGMGIGGKGSARGGKWALSVGTMSSSLLARKEVNFHFE